MISRDDDVVLHPNPGPCGRSRRVLLQFLVMSAGVNDQVPRGYLINRASAILEQTVGFGPAAVVVLCDIATRVVIDLHFEAREYRGPGRVCRDGSAFGVRPLPEHIGHPMQRIPEAHEYTAV